MALVRKSWGGIHQNLLISSLISLIIVQWSCASHPGLRDSTASTNQGSCLSLFFREQTRQAVSIGYLCWKWRAQTWFGHEGTGNTWDLKPTCGARSLNTSRLIQQRGITANRELMQSSASKHIQHYVQSLACPTCFGPLSPKLTPRFLRHHTDHPHLDLVVRSSASFSPASSASFYGYWSPVLSCSTWSPSQSTNGQLGMATT